ncbi:MAG TPA: helix-turn-helix domain-containing protein [Ktedonobacterales bacterium]|jgi:excisionase family DNA binding protein
MLEHITQEETLLTFKEAMSFLRVSRSTLYRLMWSGQLCGHKVGSTWRFYKQDLRSVVTSAPVAVGSGSHLYKQDLRSVVASAPVAVGSGSHLLSERFATARGAQNMPREEHQ